MADRRSTTSVTARPTEFNSLSLFNAGINFAKRHYLLTATYIVGLLVVQFASGLAVSHMQRQQFDQALGKIDMHALDQAKENAMIGKK